MAGVLGIEEGCKAPDSVVTGSGPAGRRGHCAPVVDAGHADMAVALRLGISDVEMQGPALLGKTTPESPINCHITGHVVAQHARSPGQG